MEWLIWIGAAITLAGLGGIIWSVILIQRARRAGLDDAGLRARLQSVVPVNVGSFLLSMLGLMCVVVGVILG
jgi:hypothetical protein